jgi:3-hydroxybutyryl-CoA dehydrogenase
VPQTDLDAAPRSAVPPFAPIHSVGILGAGTMGAGIAATTVLAGLPTVLVDPSQAVLDRARLRLDGHLARQVTKGRLTARAAAEARDHLTFATEARAVAGADLVIEAVFERLDVKTEVLAALESRLAPECLIATNTSCLRVSEIATALRRPERFLGLHYFSPVEANPLVEVIEGVASRPGIAAEVSDFLAATGRVALPCRDSHGFAINRFFCPYVNEAIRCLREELATAGQIDAVARDVFGQALGPLATTNVVGFPVMLHALENLSHLGPSYAPARLLVEMAASGGRFEIEEEPAPLAPGRAAAIADRLRGALYLPLNALLAEGVASAADVDRGAAVALRFAAPPARTMLEDPRRADLIAALEARHR